MKKMKVMMMCCLLVGCIGMFAACGANDNNTGNTQNNAVTDTMNNGNNTDNGNTADTNGNGTTGNNANGNNTTGNNVKKDVDNLGDDVVDMGEDVVDGVEDAGDAVVDGVTYANDTDTASSEFAGTISNAGLAGMQFNTKRMYAGMKIDNVLVKAPATTSVTE